MIFATTRLYTRNWTADDIAAAKKLWGDPKVTELIDARDQLNQGDIKEKLDQQIKLQQQYQIAYWALCLKSTDEVIGCCGLRPYDLDNHIYELGFHIMSAFWRQGYATESAHGAIDYAFDKLKAYKLFAGHNPNNHTSKKVLEKLGFQFIRDEFYVPTGLMHPSYELDNPRL